MVNEHYDHVWDCCCDHGSLGKALLLRQAADLVHFVDIVPHLMSQLTHNLEKEYPTLGIIDRKPSWQTHCIDAAQLPLQDFSGKHLIIIAGIGGDLTTDLLIALRAEHPKIEIDFLLCPVYHQAKLRKYLIQSNASLVDEALVKERQQFYEVILVSTQPNTKSPVSPTGSLIWQCNNPEQVQIAKQYLAKIRVHYERAATKRKNEVIPILEAYNAITITLSHHEKAKQLTPGD